MIDEKRRVMKGREEERGIDQERIVRGGKGREKRRRVLEGKEGREDGKNENRRWKRREDGKRGRERGGRDENRRREEYSIRYSII